MKEREYKPRSSTSDREDRGDKYDKYSDMDDAMDEGGGRGRNRKFANGNKKKSCRFTAGEEDINHISYKNPRFLATFMTEHGKIVPRRVTGNCAFVQRKLTTEIKRARQLGLLGFTAIGPHSAY